MHVSLFKDRHESSKHIVNLTVSKLNNERNVHYLIITTFSDENKMEQREKYCLKL